MNIEMYLPDRALNELVGVPIQKKVQNPFWQATEMDKAGDHEGAQRIYHELLAPDFNDACVLGALGMSYAIQGNQGVAFTCLSKALSLFDERFADDLRKHGIKFAEKAPPGKDTFLTQKKAELMNAIGTCYKQENVIDKARYWFEKSQNTLSRISADVQNNLCGTSRSAIWRLATMKKALLFMATVSVLLYAVSATTRTRGRLLSGTELPARRSLCTGSKALATKSCSRPCSRMH
jgi:tetratricopeptide (TPR) repeat protein